MSSVQPFDFEGTSVRTITYETGQTWWVLSDVAKSLAVQNTTDLAKRLDEDERSRFNLGRQGEAWIINESGLYNVILRSDKPEARRFRKWVTGEVLPQIRRTGGYVPGSSPELIMANAVLIAQKTIEQQKAQLEAQAPKVAFSDALTASKDCILIGHLSKLLRQNGVQIGQNRLYQWLRDHKYLSSRKGADWNMPTQKYVEQGLFQIKIGTYSPTPERTFETRTPMVTGKGQQYFVNKFLGEQGIGKAA
jgi:anti-repressor protein